MVVSTSRITGQARRRRGPPRATAMGVCAQASAASEPRDRSEPAQRRARARVGGSGGAKPPGLPEESSVKRRQLQVRLVVWAGITVCAIAGVNLLAQGAPQQQPASARSAASTADQSDRRSDAEAVRVALDRPCQHGRTDRRHRRGREQTQHLLHRAFHCGNLEDHQQRHDLDADLRRIPGRFRR